MTPNGVESFILSSANTWVPWTGVATGQGGVVLYDVNGNPLNVAVADDIAYGTAGSGRNLRTSTQVYNLSPTDATQVRAQPFTFDADALPNVHPSAACNAAVSNRNYGYNATDDTWDRVRSFAGNADDIVAPTLGLLGTRAFPALFDGTTYDRAYSLPSDSDAQVAAQIGLAGSVARQQAFNGTTFDRLRTNSAASLSAASQPFAQMVANPGEWAINHTPAANTIATITRAAGAAGVRHVCRSLTMTLIGLAAAAEATVLVNLRDGASGAGTILWSIRLLVTGTTGSESGISLSNLNIFGTAATAMTLEFAVAGGANTFETVALTGYDTV